MAYAVRPGIGLCFFLKQGLGLQPDCRHEHILATRAYSTRDHYLTSSYAQAPRKKFNQAFVGFPVHRGRSKAHFDAIAVYTDYFGALGSRLGLNMESKAITA